MSELPHALHQYADVISSHGVDRNGTLVIGLRPGYRTAMGTGNTTIYSSDVWDAKAQLSTVGEDVRGTLRTYALTAVVPKVYGWVAVVTGNSEDDAIEQFLAMENPDKEGDLLRHYVTKEDIKVEVMTTDKPGAVLLHTDW